jgi:hypothetical protein
MRWMWMGVLAACVVMSGRAADAVVMPYAPATQLEGPNVPEGTYLSVGNHNCQPPHTADGTLLPDAAEFSQCWVLQSFPTATGHGPIVVTACQYHAADPLPSLPPGDWYVAGARCPAAYAAVCTRDQEAGSGGGDGGCDTPWPGPAALAPQVATPRDAAPAPVLSTGHCHVRRSGRTRCTFW